MKGLVLVVVLLGTVVSVASAHEGKLVDLKAAPPDHQVETVRYCDARYEVSLKDGSVQRFPEFDLRFKTDSSPNGPKPGAPALVRAGMVGDRAFLVFARPEEMTEFIKRC